MKPFIKMSRRKRVETFEEPIADLCNFNDYSGRNDTAYFVKIPAPARRKDKHRLSQRELFKGLRLVGKEGRVSTSGVVQVYNVQMNQAREEVREAPVSDAGLVRDGDIVQCRAACRKAEKRHFSDSATMKLKLS